jgi:APA family basic amino acid/polyamine antiporter
MVSAPVPVRKYSDLLDYVIFAVLLFFAVTILAIFILRKKRPEIPRPYKAFGYPVIPALYIIVVVFIMIILLMYKPNYTFPGLGIVILGIPVYYLWKRNSRNNPEVRDNSFEDMKIVLCIVTNLM